MFKAPAPNGSLKLSNIYYKVCSKVGGYSQTAFPIPVLFRASAS